MTEPVPNAVVAQDLSLYYPARKPENRSIAVNGVNFAIAHGEVLAVVGETGSGKSTLATVVAGQGGLMRSDSPQFKGGSLSVLGTDVRTMSGRQRDRLGLRVGYLEQDAGAHLAPRLTVGENVAEPIFSRDRKFNQREAGEAVATLVDAVRLPMSTMNKYPHELSKGQRQRIAIARALILEPVLLVADDPTAGIDVTVRGSILDIIRDLQQQRSFSALVVTADLAEVRRISSRLMIMQKGGVVGVGDVDEILDDPTDPYVIDLAKSVRENEEALRRGQKSHA
ncbi:MAG: dipeptide/oligopeptide/nickel ABC transporter ATP-binding protein [Rhodoglobus sp.]